MRATYPRKQFRDTLMLLNIWLS